MKRMLIAFATAISLLVATSVWCDAGGKSYSSGGSSGSGSSRSYSSGSSRSYSPPSSSTRSYSSGGSSGGSSKYSSGGSSGGSSKYSSGGSSTPKYSSGGGSSGGSSKYSSGGSSGGSNKYSSGGSSTPKYSSGSTPSAKPYSSGKSQSDTPHHTAPSGKSYSSGSTPAPHADSPSGKSYSSGKSPSAPPTGPPSGDSKKPTHSNFNAGLSQAAKEQQSKVAYQKATAPKPVYTDPKGKEHKLDPADKKVGHVRDITHEHYVTRETRVRTFYEPYYSRPIVTYSDPFGPFFYLWLFDRCSADQRAEWAYHHRAEMDDARWRDMCAKDAQLEARVKQLEAEKRARDPGYVPPGIPADQKDLMYNDQFVQASYNAERMPVAESSVSGATVFWIILGIIAVPLLIWAFVYFFFIKNYDI